MNDGVLGDFQIVRVEYLQQEDGLDKNAFLIQFQCVIQAIGSQYPHGINLGYQEHRSAVIPGAELHSYTQRAVPATHFWPHRVSDIERLSPGIRISLF